MNRIIRWTAAALAVSAAVIIVVLTSRPRPAPQPPALPDTTATCAQRLARVGQALRLYAQDHEGWFPIAPTAAEAEEHLLRHLADPEALKGDLRCPARPQRPYVYHSYHARGPGAWPNWMADEHIVTPASPPDTWLMADFIERDRPGPHSETQKAFNFLRVDGSVQFHAGRPREVYR